VVPSPKSQVNVSGSPSASDERAALKATAEPSLPRRSGPASATGAKSSLTMVPVAEAVPSTAPTGLDSVSVNVSSASRSVSPATATRTVACVCPAASVAVPPAAV
jgi:hypothetical protein